MATDLIIGSHSIVEALLNSERSNKTLIGVESSIKDLKKNYPQIKKIIESIEVEVVKSNHVFQQVAEKLYKETGFKFSRVPGNILLSCSQIPYRSIGGVFDELKQVKNKRVICLDQVTDPQNAAAVLRTASFYGVDAVVIPGKSSSGFSPSFFRIASGAAEHVRVYAISNLSRFISRFNELGGLSIGFSEHASGDHNSEKYSGENTLLVLGNEEKGISNAVSRQVSQFISLKTQGNIKSLNVSVAAAVAMEKFFGTN